MRLEPRVINILAALILAALLFPLPGQAGLDAAAPVVTLANAELVVLEADGCTYCALFRRDVLPSYQNSARAKEAPIRFVDVNDVGTARIELTAPIDVVPTFVVVKNHKEIGRIPGYVGPETFYHTINYLLDSAP